MGAYLSLHSRESGDQISYLVPPTSILVKQVGMHHLHRLVRLNLRNGFRKSGEGGDNTTMHHKPEKTCTQNEQRQRSYQPMLEIRERGKSTVCRTLYYYSPTFL